MNILQVVPEMNVGGVETGTLDLARWLIGNGHKAVVVSNGGELVKELREIGATHYSLPVDKKSVFSIIRTIPKLAEIIRKENIEVVHARSRVPAWVGFFACRRTGAAFVTTCHGYYKKHFFSYPMGWGKRVIAISNVIARHMIDDFGVERGRIRLIHRSVDMERFTYRDPARKRAARFNVGLIGRMTPLKGHVYFIKAMARVARQVPELKVWIVGDAPASKAVYKEEVQLLTRRLGLWQNTDFLGTQRNIPEIMSHLDALVLPTVTHEAFGRVIVEAQAAGVPVVATKVGGVIDVIEDGVTGFLVPPADPDAIAERLLQLYRDPALAGGIARRAYDKAIHFYTLERMARETLEVYREAKERCSVLVIKLSSLGDIILSTAAFHAIREKFGTSCSITLAVGEDFRDIVLRSPRFDDLAVVDLKGKDRGLFGLLRVGAQLRRKSFDIVIDLQNNRASHALAFLSGAPRRYGYDNRKWGFLLTDKLRNKKDPVDPLTHQFRLLAMLGIPDERKRLELWPSEDDARFVDEALAAQWLSAQQKLVGINIGASRRWRTKSLPLGHLAKICEALSARDIRVVLTGSADDAVDAHALSVQLKNARPVIMCGKTTVNQLACLVKRCAVFVSGDSAPLHIAAAVGTPFVAVFGPTDARRHLPPAPRYVLIRKDVSCGPCYKPECRHKKCMESIRPDEIVDAVEHLLRKA